MATLAFLSASPLALGEGLTGVVQSFFQTPTLPGSAGPHPAIREGGELAWLSSPSRSCGSSCCRGHSCSLRRRQQLSGCEDADSAADAMSSSLDVGGAAVGPLVAALGAAVVAAGARFHAGTRNSESRVTRYAGKGKGAMPGWQAKQTGDAPSEYGSLGDNAFVDSGDPNNPHLSLQSTAGAADDMAHGERNLWESRKTQLSALTNQLKQRHKSGPRSRMIKPKIEFAKAPPNPWRDRYLLCRECENRYNYKEKGPRRKCNNSTLLEVDMTAPFSRDNVMAISCELIQMIRDDVYARRSEDGELHRAQKFEKGMAHTFPVQVCAVCRQTSIDENKKFKTCHVCKGAHYCSNICFAKHRLQHRASCTQPIIPYRAEWGIRKELRRMRDEIYPLIGIHMIRGVKQHLFAWRKKETQLLPSGASRTLDDGAQRLLPGPNEDSAIVKQEAVIFKASKPKTRTYAGRVKGPLSEPDEVVLNSLGMTLEQYREKDAYIETKFKAEYEETLRLREADMAKALTYTRPENQPESPYKKVKAPLLNISLDEDAIARLEDVGVDLPPADRTKRLSGRPPWEAPPELERENVIEEKEGVVYQKAKVAEKVAKKMGLQLSEEQLERLEAAGKVGKHMEKDRRFVKATVDQDLKDRLLLD
eukprot:TRINITY_DN74169_c0_g1_i1.p1 TRINITY_DN74169_c0_g1~~TRINITY_DN74169_c0_g1_i1.p1  ORF type:complete len:647 (-),score=172.68 TRINITY_DN74169_c0_g1_i1:296-2236(-)